MLLWLSGERMGERIVRESEMDRYTLLYIKWINSKDLVYGTGNHNQHLIIVYDGRESEKEYLYLYI